MAIYLLDTSVFIDADNRKDFPMPQLALYALP